MLSCYVNKKCLVNKDIFTSAFHVYFLNGIALITETCCGQQVIKLATYAYLFHQWILQGQII